MMNADAVCQVCGGKPTIKSHIIPRGFARDARGDDPHLLGITMSKEFINQSGFIDRKILCAACDGLLGKDDKFATEFCRANKDFNPAPTDRTCEFQDLPAPFVRFVNGVAFRSSISSLHGFEAFKLHSDLEQQIQLALFGSGGSLLEMVAFRYRVTGDIDPFGVFTYPYFHTDESGVEFATFSVGRFRLSLRIGGAQLSPPLSVFVLNSASKIIAPTVNFEKTTEYARMAEFSKLHGT
jgi:hypothetical protein